MKNTLVILASLSFLLIGCDRNRKRVQIDDADPETQVEGGQGSNVVTNATLKIPFQLQNGELSSSATVRISCTQSFNVNSKTIVGTSEGTITLQGSFNTQVPKGGSKTGKRRLSCSSVTVTSSGDTFTSSLTLDKQVGNNESVDVSMVNLAKSGSGNGTIPSGSNPGGGTNPANPEKFTVKGQSTNCPDGKKFSVRELKCK